MLVFKKNDVSKIIIVCLESFRKHVLQITYINLLFPNVPFLYYLKKSGGIKRGLKRGYKKGALVIVTRTE